MAVLFIYSNFSGLATFIIEGRVLGIAGANETDRNTCLNVFLIEDFQ